MNTNAAKQRLESVSKQVLETDLGGNPSFAGITFFKRQEATVYTPPCVLSVCEDCAIQDGLDAVMMYEAVLDVYLTTSLVLVDTDGDEVNPPEDHTDRAGILEDLFFDPIQEFVDKLNNTERVWVHFAEPGTLESMNTERTWVDKIPIQLHFQHITEEDE